MIKVVSDRNHNYSVRATTLDDIYRFLIKFNRKMKDEQIVTIVDIHKFVRDFSVINDYGWVEPIVPYIDRVICNKYSYIVKLPKITKINGGMKNENK